jgi:uncharacterized protein (TIGR02453 family)
MDRFEGFADSDAKFFKELSRHQTREWFQSHKQEFEEGWNRPMKMLLSEVREAIDKAYPHCDLDEPKVFRIFRDVRFSKDKTPYKTHVAGYIPIKLMARATEVPAAIYLQLGIEAIVGAGQYMMDGPALQRYRSAVANDTQGKQLQRILARLSAKGLEVSSYDQLARVPKGFPPDHPRADLLKRKGLIVSLPDLPRPLITSRKFLPWLVERAQPMAPLVEWLVFATA